MSKYVGLLSVVGAALLGGIASTALACDMPPLVVIPAKEAIAGQEQQVRDSTAAYFDAMKAFTGCVQAELAAAGGDSAPPVTKAVLVQRNNHAVAEAQAVLKLFNANLGGAPGANAPAANGPPTPAPGAQKDEHRRRGH
jgi:hypothetical protein